MNYALYGDGIHDDYPAIQEMPDSRLSEIALPVPEKNYLISKTLKLRGGKCPFIWVQKGLDIDGLSISNVEREEKVWRTPLLKVDEGAPAGDQPEKPYRQPCVAAGAGR